MYCLSTFSAPKLCLPPGSTAFGNTTLRPLPPLALSSTNRIVGTSLPANSLIRRSSVRQRTESLMPKRVRSFLAKAKRFGPESGPATGTLLIIVLTVLLMSGSGHKTSPSPIKSSQSSPVADASTSAASVCSVTQNRPCVHIQGQIVTSTVVRLF